MDVEAGKAKGNAVRPGWSQAFQTPQSLKPSARFLTVQGSKQEENDLLLPPSSRQKLGFSCSLTQGRMQ